MLKKLWVLLLLVILLPLRFWETTDATSIRQSMFFNDVVFVGDSVTNQIRRYRTGMRNEGQETLFARFCRPALLYLVA